jgi:aminopeptidase N
MHTATASESELRVEFNTVIAQDSQLSLTVHFRTTISECPTGIFRSHHVDAHGLEHIYVATHMEPRYASRVFPCFDNPAQKARFAIQLRTSTSAAREPQHRCLSNMPLLSAQEDVAAQQVLYTFAETMPMSTYASTPRISFPGLFFSEGLLHNLAPALLTSVPDPLVTRSGRWRSGGHLG